MAKKPRQKNKRSKAKSGQTQREAPIQPVQPSAMAPKVGPVKYVGQVRQEARKVVWPTRRETIVTTILVMIMTVLMGAFFFLTDTIISTIVNFIIGFGS